MKQTILSLALLCCSVAFATDLPKLPLAGLYRDDIDLSQYLVSEKYDGVRAYWDGQQLLSRRGNVIRAPAWFIALLPNDAHLDGELWMGRSSFSRLSGAVRRQPPDNAEWRRIRYMVFDIALTDTPFRARLARLRGIISRIGSEHVQLVEQRMIADAQDLMRWMRRVVAGGGEGLMLRRRDSLYRGGRSDDLLKLKPFEDAEAVVIAHLPGQGRLQGVLGALLLETEDGRRFRVGSGFSDQQRRNPPAIGSTVTYRYRGLTSTGLPRFATFVRERIAH